MRNGSLVRQMREVTSNTGGLSQNSSFIHFGLRDTDEIEQMYVVWPVTGKTQDVNVTEVNGQIAVIESVDADGDGISDEVDVETPGLFSDGISSGSIINLGDQSLSISDSPYALEGIYISASIDGGPVPAELSVCDGTEVIVPAGSQIVVTCSSVTVKAIRNSVLVRFVGSNLKVAEVNLIENHSITFDPLTFLFKASPQNADPITIRIDQRDFYNCTRKFIQSFFHHLYFNGYNHG